MAEEQPVASTSASAAEKEPVVILVIGMAGSGKTTLMQRLNSYLHSKDKPPYILNLDPAVSHMPYAANIDIRDTVDYKEVMKQYNLGPNGGIMTALNLFTTKFDQVLGFVEKRAQAVDYVLVDTPGQIEIFTWSASGAIITDAIASSLPTCVAYVIDTPRTSSPATFMSNMLILYKTRLPFILVFNKIDVEPHDFAIDWMKDFEAFQAALEERGRDENGESYMNSLMGSMCLVLEEFYNNLRAVGVSAMTGEGMKDFFNAVEECRQEYLKDYRPELERLKAEKEEKAEAAKAAHMERLMRDMGIDSEAARKANPFGPHARNDREDAYLDHHGDSEDEAIEQQREMEEEADAVPEVSQADLPPLEYGGREADVPFPAPR
ncbi:hypothetical protein CspeluHIS016_0900110 [Cutaneotrichosporon spelunceum]|uniref:GPN-loop GTPase n=1 Tax=Cutaneotrichosporon spelunceum TaxID=1672016 RepID=A0AAD3U071_9TREE|nr:hypothetical protein CspeluHIS016_0900110 [Cutaneotrichosporon spelunceum]